MSSAIITRGVPAGPPRGRETAYRPLAAPNTAAIGGFERPYPGWFRLAILVGAPAAIWAAIGMSISALARI